MSSFLTYKRWRLRDDVEPSAVETIVRDKIVAHYRRLDATVRLRLEQIDDGTVLAIQRWPDREHWQRVTTGPAFDAWFNDYRPLLDEWDQLVIFEAEWETRELL